MKVNPDRARRYLRRRRPPRYQAGAVGLGGITGSRLFAASFPAPEVLPDLGDVVRVGLHTDRYEAIEVTITEVPCG